MELKFNKHEAELILNGTLYHGGRLKLAQSWANAMAAKDEKAAAVYSEILFGTVDDVRRIELIRQLIFSGLAFTAGFITALVGYLN
jgi:hypothetical protein